MITMIIDRTKSRNNRSSVGITFRKLVILQKTAVVKTIAFGNKSVRLSKRLISEKPPIGRETSNLRSRCNRSGCRFQTPMEEVVKGGKGISRGPKFCRIDSIFLDKW